MLAYRSTGVSNGPYLFLVALFVVCGLFSFVLCLVAEGSRTEVSWYTVSKEGEGSDTYQCIYNASGRRPLVFALSAFLLLVAAMLIEHAYMLLVAISPTRAVVLCWIAAIPRLSPLAGKLIRNAPFIYLTNWICFAVAAALLMIGMAAESSHICHWTKPMSSCRVVRPGLFAAAGVFGLLTLLLGISMYLLAIRLPPAAVLLVPPFAAATPSAPPLAAQI